MGDAEGDTGLTDEGDHNAVALDALDLTLDAGKGAVKDAHTTVLLVDEVGISQGDALGQGIKTGGRGDEVLHLTVGNPDDGGGLGDVTRPDRHELHDVAGGVETLEELELDLHGADEHKTVDRGVLVDEHTPIVVDYRWLDIEIGVVALVAQFVVDIIGPFAPGVGDAHGIPVKLVVVGLLAQVAVEAAVVVEEQELVLVKQLERFWIGDKDRCARAWGTSGNNWFFRLVAHHPKCLYTAIFATSKSIGISKLYFGKTSDRGLTPGYKKSVNLTLPVRLFRS